jgi:ubiquinone/menaquinone biosynthesis C-methylase UbiE
MKVLFQRLAKYYDKIYRLKDYKKEVDFIQFLFQKFNLRVKTILDVACGTGSHAILLKKMGYDLVGVDISKEMLQIAREKVKGVGFIEGDMRKLRLNKKFDAVLCLFSSIAYNQNYDELEQTLRNFYNHLKEKGILIFDNGFFKETFNENRTWIDLVDEENLKLIRFGNRQKLEKNFKVVFVYIWKENGKLDFDFDEHVLGMFEIKEVKKIMEKVGFRTMIFNGFDNKRYTGKEQEFPRNLVFVGLKKT